MVHLTLQALTDRLRQISFAYSNNDLYTSSDLWDKTMLKFFGMENRINLRNDSIPCKCNHYANIQMDSGLILLLYSKSNQQQLSQSASFFGNFWIPDTIQSRDFVKKNSLCGNIGVLSSIPNYVKQFYFPENVFSYLLENWKNASIYSIIQNSQLSKKEFGIEIPIK